MRVLRPIALVSSLLAVSSASFAVDVSVSTKGTVTQSRFGPNDDYFLSSETIVSQDLGGLATLTRGSFQYGRIFNDPPQAFIVLNTGPDVRAPFLRLQLTVASDATALGVRSMSGTWKYYYGTGLFELPPIHRESVGTWTFAWDQNSNATQMSVDGVFDKRPVPEPTTIAALGLGVLGLMRRRKKA